MGIGRNLILTFTALNLVASPLPAEEAAEPLLTALASITIAGYADVSAHWNPGPGRPIHHIKGHPAIFGGTDILWQHQDGRVAISFMSGTKLNQSTEILIPQSPLPGIRKAASLTKDAIFLQQSHFVWKNGVLLNVSPAVPLKHMTFAGAANLAGSEDADVAWISRSCILVWEIDGRHVTRQHVIHTSFNFPPDSKVVGIDRFDADNSVDLLWSDPRGFVWVTLMDGIRVKGNVILNNGRPANPKWSLRGVGHFNSDGKADLLWQHEDGRTAVWFMHGTTRIGSALLLGGTAPAPGWKVLDTHTSIYWLH